MPIYAYKCDACGHTQDILRKLSDPALTLCPVCGQDALAKQVTAAGFQLKGSGWYVTDFRGGEKAGDGANSGIATAPKSDSKPGDSAAPVPVSAANASAPAAASPAGSPPAPKPNVPAPSAPVAAPAATSKPASPAST